MQEVFFMHEYPIEGVQNGTLRAEKDGLYWKIDASCTRDWDHPIRLLAETDGVRVSLGVPQPEGEKLRLQCRLSARSCPLSDGTRVRTDQQPEQTLLPFEPEKPFDHISDFSVLQVVEQDGKPYWTRPQQPDTAEDDG